MEDSFPSEINLPELARAQEVDEELKTFLKDPKSSLVLKSFNWGTDHTPLICDVSGESLRPFVPKPFPRKIFDLFHNPAHPGGKVTDKIIRKRFVWPNMNKEIKELCRVCINCKKSKVSRHSTPLPSHFVAPDSWFRHVHLDIVGPISPVWDIVTY